MTIYIRSYNDQEGWGSETSISSPFVAEWVQEANRTGILHQFKADGVHVGASFDWRYTVNGVDQFNQRIVLTGSLVTASSGISVNAGQTVSFSGVLVEFLECAEPNGMQMMVWDTDGKLYSKNLSAAGGAFALSDFPGFSGGASRVGVRVIQSDEIAKTGQKWRFTLIRGAADVALNISFPPGVTISGTTYTTIFDFEFSSGARSLASGILPLPNFFDLGLQYQLVAEGTCDDLEEEEAYDDVPAEDGPAIPPEPPPTPEEPPDVEEPIWPTEPSPPTSPTVPTAPETGCECEIYIAEAIMWAASWLADCFALAIQTFVEWAPWFLEAFWEQAWALYEYHGEKIERHHEETLLERQRQTALMERQAEALEGIMESIQDIPVPEILVEQGLPVSVQSPSDDSEVENYIQGW